MRKLSPKVLLVIAAVLSVLCGFLIYSYLAKNSANTKAKNTTPVVIATMDIAPGVVLTDKMVRLELVPANIAQPDAMRTLPDAVGKRIMMPVNAGDQITKKRMNANGAANSFVQSIPKDKRAVTISVDDISGVAGFIRPSTFVDVVSIQGQSNSAPTTGRLVLQKVLVLAVGSTDIATNNGKKNEAARNVTLALDPREAVELRVAQQDGKISFLLRPNDPTEDEFFGATVYGKSAPRVVAPPPSSGGNYARPSANHGVTVIRGTNISR